MTYYSYIHINFDFLYHILTIFFTNVTSCLTNVTVSCTNVTSYDSHNFVFQLRLYIRIHFLYLIIVTIYLKFTI